MVDQKVTVQEVIDALSDAWECPESAKMLPSESAPTASPHQTAMRLFQLSAYQQGLGFGIRPCANVFVSRNTKGLAVCHVWNEAEMLKGLDIFNATLALWKAIKGYDGSFVEKVK